MVAGLIQGLIQKDDLPHLQKCMKNANPLRSNSPELLPISRKVTSKTSSRPLKRLVKSSRSFQVTSMTAKKSKVTFKRSSTGVNNSRTQSSLPKPSPRTSSPTGNQSRLTSSPSTPTTNPPNTSKLVRISLISPFLLSVRSPTPRSQSHSTLSSQRSIP